MALELPDIYTITIPLQIDANDELRRSTKYEKNVNATLRNTSSIIRPHNLPPAAKIRHPQTSLGQSLTRSIPTLRLSQLCQVLETSKIRLTLQPVRRQFPVDKILLHSLDAARTWMIHEPMPMSPVHQNARILEPARSFPRVFERRDGIVWRIDVQQRKRSVDVADVSFEALGCFEGPMRAYPRLSGEGVGERAKD